MKKTCSKCKIEKEITEFYRGSRNSDGHCSRCKRCECADQKRRREEAKANHLYKVECPGGYYYIGSTTQGMEQRSKKHIHSGDQTTISRYVQENSLSKEDLKYSVVGEFEDPEEMRVAERELIKSCYTDPLLLNEMLIRRRDYDMERNSKRFCSKCKIEKPVEEFSYDKSTSRLSSNCGKCKNDWKKLHRQANKEEYTKRDRERGLTPERVKWRKEYYEANKEEYAKRGKAYRKTEKYKEYREANKEKALKYTKKYREANKEKVQKQRREYYKANKEKIAKREKEYYEANKEKIAKRQKEYYEANKEKIAKGQKESRARKKLLDKQ